METSKPLIEAKKNYHHGDLRGQLLEAVRLLVEEKGPDGWSIAEACRAAGVSTAAPYKHFKDRRDIMKSLILSAMGRLRAKMQAGADAFPAGRPERIAAIGDAYLSFAREEPGMFRLVFSVHASGEEDPEMKAAGENTGGIVDRVVAEHLGIPADSAEARGRSYALWCFVHGHSFLGLDRKVGPDHVAVSEAEFLRFVGEQMLDPGRKMDRS